MRIRFRRTPALSTVVLLAALAVPAPATARTEIDTQSLGMGERISFRERTDEVGLAVPVPAGLSADLLTGTVQTPVDLASGHLEAWSDDMLLARIPLDGRESLVPVEIPLEKAPVRAGVANVTLRTVLTSLGEACPDWSARSLELLDSEVVYEGEPEAPRVLADFIPPVLERLEIYLPDQPSRVEAEAAAELATASAAEFGQRGLEVAVLPVDGARPRSASPFTRRVEIREDEVTRVDLVPGEVPTVEISGDEDSLSVQARTVSTGLRELAVADSATLEGPLAAPRALAAEITLDDLDVGTVTSRGSGSVTARFGLDQTRVGGVVGDATLSLRGMYSPPPSGRSGLVVVTADGTVVDSWVAEQSGVIDRTVTLPASTLGRYTDIAVTLQTSGAGAACGVLQPLTMLLDGNSRIEFGEAASPAPRGFDSLPQALMPRLHVATGSQDLSDVSRAITLLVELQTLSSSLLRPEWVSPEDLVSGEVPGVLVASDAKPQDLRLPLEITGGRALEVVGAGEREPAVLRFYEDIDFASLQVVQDRGRALLVASSTSGSDELDRTLEWLDAEPERWGALRGDVVFTAPGRDPVALSTAQAVGEADAPSSGGVDTALIVGGVSAVAGLALAGLLWVATRGRRTGRRS